MCYFFSEAHKNFSQAVIDCKQKGGKLAEPKDDRTRKILINNANGYPWIGIKKVGSTWKYVSDGSTVARMKWSSGHPNGAGNCIMIQKGLTGYYDYVCNSTYRYICEFWKKCYAKRIINSEIGHYYHSVSAFLPV